MKRAIEKPASENGKMRGSYEKFTAEIKAQEQLNMVSLLQFAFMQTSSLISKHCPDMEKYLLKRSEK